MVTVLGVGSLPSSSIRPALPFPGNRDVYECLNSRHDAVVAHDDEIVSAIGVDIHRARVGLNIENSRRYARLDIEGRAGSQCSGRE